jgi:hypothetical protein
VAAIAATSTLEVARKTEEDVAGARAEILTETVTTRERKRRKSLMLDPVPLASRPALDNDGTATK